MTDPVNPFDRLRTMRKPIHPGEYIREEFLPFFRLSVYELAAKIGVPYFYLESVTNETKPITAEIAIGLSEIEESDPKIWMDVQSIYDLWQAYHNRGTPGSGMGGPVSGYNSPGPGLGGPAQPLGL